MSLLVVLFFISIGSVLHTYVFYPLYLDSRKTEPRKKGIQSLAQPIDVVIAAYNEEKVIEEKIHSIFFTDYPTEKIRVLVGSDGSTDRTDEIVTQLQSKYPNIFLEHFERSGKTAMIDRLMTKVEAPIVVLTDANVIFTPSTLKNLIAYFQDDRVGLVGANIKAKKDSEVGITHQENEYLQRENKMKLKEGELWGTMMGAFGGCYALRKSLFRPVPEHFLVDDFHITMSVLGQGYDAILAQEALCYEDISTKLSEEFRRKVRMSRGNFQNLRKFASFIASSRRGLSFSFISHKVLRWLTPLFLIAAFISSFLLMEESQLFYVLFYLQLTVFCIPIMELTLDSLGIRSRLIRFITYFLSMNLALLVGMFRSLKKVRSATWEPTERNQ